MKLAQKLAIKYVKAKLRMTALLSKKKAAKKALKLFSTPRRKAKVKTAAIFNKGEKLSFELEGHPILGHRWASNGNPLKKTLILHGYESSSKKFSDYISALIDKGYEVLAFDAPAHGDSGGKKINLPLYTKMIATIDKNFGPIQSFMAHSFGGLALVHFLESVNLDEKTRIVLIAPATETTTAIDMFFEFLELDNEVRTAFDRLLFEKFGKTADYYSTRRAIQNIHAPILWLHDEEDDVTPIRDALKVKEDKHPNVEFILTKGLGHRKIYRDENVIKQVVGFL